MTEVHRLACALTEKWGKLREASGKRQSDPREAWVDRLCVPG